MPYLDNFNVSGSLLKIRDLEAQESITKIAESINSSVGNSNKPIFLDKGNFKECNDILNVNISGNANSATEANHALTADSATEANHALTADSATNSDYSNNSGMLNGHDSNYFSPSTHKHDDRYYTMKQVNNLLNGKVDTTSLETSKNYSGLTKTIDANNKRQLRVNSDSSVSYALLDNGTWIARKIFSVITVTADSTQGVTIKAPNVDGYTFVAWIGVASNGFVGSPHIENCGKATTRIFDANVTSGQSYNAYALYSILR